MEHQPSATYVAPGGVKTQRCEVCQTTRQISDDGLRTFAWMSGRKDCRGPRVQAQRDVYEIPSHRGKAVEDCTPEEIQAKLQDARDLFE